MSDAAVWDLIRGGVAPTPESVRRAVDAPELLGADGVEEERARLARSVLGAGPLQAWLETPEVTDVVVNGTEGVYVDRGRGLEEVSCPVGGADDVRRLAVRLAGLAGRRLDETTPCVDGLLPGGVRLHAVLPPLVDGAAHLSLRVPARVLPRLDELGRRGSFPPAWERVLREIVAARVSFVVSGGTGSGKTTLLAALLAEVDPRERIVLVEDVREMARAHPHVVRLQTRQANVEGKGAVDMVELVRASLRMRPDRLVVGEVRGPEVREMLAALNTGHDGGACTVHANGVEDLVARCEALGAMAGMTPAALRTQLASAIRVVVHVRREGGARYVDQVGVLARTGDDGLAVVVALERDVPDGAAPGYPELMRLIGRAEGSMC